jgi:hypothetical protein
MVVNAFLSLLRAGFPVSPGSFCRLVMVTTVRAGAFRTA